MAVRIGGAVVRVGVLSAGLSLAACSGADDRTDDEARGSGGASGAGGGTGPLPDAGPAPDAWAPPDAEPPPGDAGPPVCAPTGGGPYWLTEGDSFSFTPSCETGHDLPADAFVVDGAPEGLGYDAARGHFTWVPDLAQAGVHEVTLRVPSLGEVGRVKLGVADRWDAEGNVPVDPATYTEEYGLPVFHLFTSDELTDEEHTPARIVYGGREYPDAEAKYRGATSLGFPKKSFTLRFARENRLDDASRGLVNERRVVLTTTFDDNSHLRQRLAYTLWNRMDPTHIQIAAFNAVLFKDGEYQGIYVVTDHVDDDLMEDHGLWRNGNLYKARSNNANFRRVMFNGSPKSVLWSGYTKEEGPDLEGEGEPSYADLEELVAWVSDATDEDFFAGLGERVLQEEFEDWWIFVSLIQANDSAGKNSYLYHDPRLGSPHPLFRYVPWDLNASFGQDWKTGRLAHDASPESFQRYNGLFERMLRDPRIRGPMLERYDALLQGELEVGGVMSLVAAWAEEVRLAAVRDATRWDDEFREHDWHDRTDFATHTEEVAYLRRFIADRWSFVDGLY